MAKAKDHLYTFAGHTARLTERQAQALKLRAEGMRLAALGQELGGVSRERARQIVEKAKRKVSGQFKAEGKEEAAAEFLANVSLWGWGGPQE